MDRGATACGTRMHRGGGVVNPLRTLLSRLSAARAFKHTNPIPDDVMNLLRQVPAEARSIRRHRRRRRPLLVKGSGS